MSLGAREHRLRATVCIAGGSDSGDYVRTWLGTERFAAHMPRVNALVQAEYETGEPQHVPTIAQGLDEATPVAIMPFPTAHD